MARASEALQASAPVHSHGFNPGIAMASECSCSCVMRPGRIRRNREATLRETC
jgi:hypothetical protein